MKERYKGTCKKHEDLCELVEDRLKEMDLVTRNHVMYKDRGREGEVDVLGFNERYLILFEVKSSDKKLWKAEQQLDRAFDHYTTRDRRRRIFTLLAYCDENNDTVVEWLRRY